MTHLDQCRVSNPDFYPSLVDGRVWDGTIPDLASKSVQNVPDYLEPIAHSFLPDLSIEIDTQLNRIAQCGRSWVKQEVLFSEDSEYEKGDILLKRVMCRSVFCPDCGSKGGLKHRQRKTSVYRKMKKAGDLSKMALRQFIFTVPTSQRDFFMSREKVVAFRKLCVELVRDVAPDQPPMVFVHLFGDLDLLYKPHINIFAIASKRAGLFIHADKLESMRCAFKKGLAAIGCKLLTTDVVDFHYSFKKTIAGISHAVKYMTRPVPSYSQVETFVNRRSSGDERILHFLLVEMKGFQYISYPRHEWDKISGSPEKSGLIAGVVLSRGTRFKMSWLLFIDQFRNHERREVYPGVYHIREGGFPEGGFINDE